MHFLHRIHPECSLTGFTSLDGTLTFYGFVRSLMLQKGARHVLDFGAGCNALAADPRPWQRAMTDLRADGAEVWASDIDPIVKAHPRSHHQVVTVPDEPLPFADDSFDLIVADWVFEHIEDPVFTAAELRRVLRPGGVICARTANSRSYPALAARIVPNRLHARLLGSVQPERRAADVHPTRYRMNSARHLKRLFEGCTISCYYASAEPAYYFDSALLYRFFLALHRLLPRKLATSVCFFIEKPVSASGEDAQEHRGAAPDEDCRKSPEAPPRAPSRLPVLQE